jgi:NAD(P)H-dependent FMN reductase
MNIFIPVILGTARKGRQSEKAAKFVLEEAKKSGLDSALLDVRDFRVKSTDNTGQSAQAKKLAAKIKKADGLIIVSPEYNHGYPGELKMMLDLLYQDYFNKPVGICGVSAGPWGGTRMVEQLRLVCIEFRMVPIREALYFPVIQDLFDESGNIKDPDYSSRVKVFLNELVWYAKALKKSREEK